MAAAAKIGLKVMSALISIPVGIATKKVVERTWVAARPENPPRETKDDGVRWGDAIGWAALSAAGVVLAELITQRGTAAAYRAITGNEPPAPKPSKKEQKQLEAAAQD
ncbi:MAG: DUF4235 domain-containing protein [Actinobacteria bacterium]|nr:DUF4235 domain-containing protein [Actinomycetota bacterium]